VKYRNARRGVITKTETVSEITQPDKFPLYTYSISPCRVGHLSTSNPDAREKLSNKLDESLRCHCHVLHAFGLEYYEKMNKQKPPVVNEVQGPTGAGADDGDTDNRHKHESTTHLLEVPTVVLILLAVCGGVVVVLMLLLSATVCYRCQLSDSDELESGDRIALCGGKYRLAEQRRTTKHHAGVAAVNEPCSPPDSGVGESDRLTRFIRAHFICFCSRVSA